MHFDDDSLWVYLDDGRVIAAPLAWFPRLLAATPVQRVRFELSPRGIHWEAGDEDISIDRLLAGHGDLTAGHGFERALSEPLQLAQAGRTPHTRA